MAATDRGTSVLCVDCRSSTSTHKIRNRMLCHDCLKKYVASKVLKRMETYRFKNQASNTKKRLFLPLSGGVSSVCLLQVLDAQVEKQLAQQGRTAYELVIGHICVDDGGDEIAWWETVKREFGLHRFLGLVRLEEVLERDRDVVRDLELLGLRREEKETPFDFLAKMSHATKTATARSDFHEILRNRLIVAVAKQESCDGIIWGHSDTTLAAKTLSSVAKGRGGAVSSEFADGPSAWGLDFRYPMRDLFQNELEAYISVLAASVQDCLVAKSGSAKEDVPASLRSTSIDQLLTRYISDQGEKYPSIMANVVKTAGKLERPSSGQGPKCRFCAMPSTPGNSKEFTLCYGCKRMKQDINP